MIHVRGLIRVLTLWVLIPNALSAQFSQVATDPWCETNHGRPWLERTCEVREVVLSAAKLEADGGHNGEIEIRQWERNEVLVRVRVEAQAETLADAADLLRRIQVRTESGRIEAPIPTLGPEQWAAVSIRIYVPSRTNLALRTVNGNIRVTGVEGEMDLESRNGSLELANVSGTIRGTTSNGGIHLILDGVTWVGAGASLATVSGGVVLSVPGDYAADLRISTNTGALTIDDLPLQCVPPASSNVGRPAHAGCQSRRIRGAFNGGGAPVSIETSTGGVHVRRRARI